MSERSPSMIEPVDDWLDAALRAEAADHRGDYLADGGFTARVMADLISGRAPQIDLAGLTIERYVSRHHAT